MPKHACAHVRALARSAQHVNVAGLLLRNQMRTNHLAFGSCSKEIVMKSADEINDYEPIPRRGIVKEISRETHSRSLKNETNYEQRGRERERAIATHTTQNTLIATNFVMSISRLGQKIIHTFEWSAWNTHQSRSHALEQWPTIGCRRSNSEKEITDQITAYARAQLSD